MARAVELIDQECSVDFIDINMGCPIDIVVNKGAGSALLTKPLRMKNVIRAACASAEKPITVKVLSCCFLSFLHTYDESIGILDFFCLFY